MRIIITSAIILIGVAAAYAMAPDAKLWKLQADLRAMGCTTAEPDGLPGPHTREAIRRWNAGECEAKLKEAPDSFQWLFEENKNERKKER